MAFQMSKDVKDQIPQSRSGSLCVPGVLGTGITSFCVSGEADLLKFLQKVLLSNVALALYIFAVTSFNLSVGISEALWVTLLMAFQNSF